MGSDLFHTDSIFEFVQKQQTFFRSLKKRFLSEKMSDSGVNPHLEGIISDFEGLLCIFLHFFCM